MRETNGEPTLVVVVEADVLGEMTSGGKRGDHPKLKSAAVHHEARAMKLFREDGIWKIDAHATDPPHVWLAATERDLAGAEKNCGSKDDRAECFADVRAIREHLATLQP